MCARVLLSLVSAALVLAPVCDVASSQEIAIPEPASAILSATEPGPKKIELQVRNEAGSDAPFREGDRLMFTVRAQDDGYLAIMGLLSDGTTTILFPNEKQPDNAIAAGQVYTFFDDNAPLRLRLGKKVRGSWVVFLVNSRRVKVDWSSIGSGEQVIKIDPSFKTEMERLREILATVVKDESFNRVAFPIGNPPHEGLDFDLVKSSEAKGEPVYKRLPSTLDSKRPGTVTGSQGLSDKPEAE